jgi:hypothetical protein
LGAPLIILQVLEFVACVTGLIYWRKIRTSVFKWFPAYLGFIVISECVGQMLNKPGMENANHAFFNYFEIPVEFLFFFWLFYITGKDNKYKALPLVCAGLYLLCWLTDTLYLSKMHFSFYSFSYTMGNLLLLVLIMRYFILLVTSNHILGFRNDMLFWICTGLLLYYLGTFPYYGLINTFGILYPKLYSGYSLVMYALNSLMYLMFTFSFIWGRPSTKSL